MSECYCETCERVFKSLGIASHRAAHLRRHESCTIVYSNGKRIVHQRLKLPRKPGWGGYKPEADNGQDD